MKILASTASTASTACAAVLLPLVLTACGSGREPLTYKERNQGEATEVAAERLHITNLRVLPPADGEVHPKGADAPATITIVNDDREPDALVEVTTDAAASVEMVKDGQPVTSVPLPATGTADPTYSLVLRGLTRELRTGQYVTMRLRFERAPGVQTLVTISAPEVPRERASANPHVNEPAHGGGGEGGHGSGHGGGHVQGTEDAVREAEQEGPANGQSSGEGKGTGEQPPAH